jgi:heme exporter protein D
MSQIAQNFQPTRNDIVAAFTFDVGKKTNATVIVFVLRIVETLGRRESVMRQRMRQSVRHSQQPFLVQESGKLVGCSNAGVGSTAGSTKDTDAENTETAEAVVVASRCVFRALCVSVVIGIMSLQMKR